MDSTMKLSILAIRPDIMRAFLATAVLFLPAPLLMAQTSVTKYSLDVPVTNQTYYNDCNNEMVVMNGTMHFEYYFSTDADGSTTRYHMSSNTKLSGIGQISGAQYVGSNSSNYQTATRGTGASNFSSTEKTRLVAQGPTPDMVLRQNIHMVVDASGHINASADSQKISCK